MKGKKIRRVAHRKPTRGMAITLRMRTAISPGQWQPRMSHAEPWKRAELKVQRIICPLPPRRVQSTVHMWYLFCFDEKETLNFLITVHCSRMGTKAHTSLIHGWYSEVDVSIFTHFMAIKSSSESHRTPKQEFSSVLCEAQTSQDRNSVE